MILNPCERNQPPRITHTHLFSKHEVYTDSHKQLLVKRYMRGIQKYSVGYKYKMNYYNKYYPPITAIEPKHSINIILKMFFINDIKQHLWFFKYGITLYNKYTSDVAILSFSSLK